ncbi:hypothetical protein B5S27_g2634 [[Candida] boidinii]|nr:hypothetical protein B5S27_g2634 [[Candida] boidinii]
MSAEGEEELLDYSDSEEIAPTSTTEVSADAATNADGETEKKGSYVGIHTTGFRDFLLKPELLRAIADCGFEHPSEGNDVLCQAKSGLGKTAVFVLSTLQQLDPTPGEVSAVVICHTRELAYQIKNEYTRFSKYMPDVITDVFYGGVPIAKDAEKLKNKDTCPHIVVGTPGRLKALVRDKYLRLNNVKNFVIDECDRVLEEIGKFQFQLFCLSVLVNLNYGPSYTNTFFWF